MNLPVRPGEGFEWLPDTGFAVFCLVAGFLFLLLGWSLYRVMFLAVGMAVGGIMGSLIGYYAGFNPLYLGVPLGLAMGVVSLLIECVGGFAAGGICGAALVFLFMPASDNAGTVLFLAGIVFVVAGIIALFIWKPVIIFAMSLLGALGMTNGTLMLMQEYNAEWTDMLKVEYGSALYLGTGVMLLGGIIFQSRGDASPSVLE